MTNSPNVIIIHGAFGNPNENWFPWLKEKLLPIGYNVVIPTFPTPEGQTLDNWMIVFDEYIKDVNEETIFVGHSIGVAFILNVLEKLDFPVKAAFLVSGFMELLGSERFDPLNESFVDHDLDWEKIKLNSEKFFIYHSDNDPYVPIRCGKEIAQKLDSDLHVVHDAGHINASVGYTKFEQLFDDWNTSITKEFKQ